MQVRVAFQERLSMKCFGGFLGFLFFILTAGSVSFAQIAAGLRGRVLDPSGAAVANAHVELIESAKNVHQSTTASSTGDYLFTNLNPGSYEVVAAAPGFQTLHHTGITVALGQTVTADIALSPGGDQQTVTVDSDYPVMQVGTSDIQTNIAAPTIAAMPLNTRNFIQLSTLAPGVELPPGRCCRASMGDGRERMSISTTASRRCSRSRGRWRTFRSLTISRSLRLKRITCRRSWAFQRRCGECCDALGVECGSREFVRVLSQ